MSFKYQNNISLLPGANLCELYIQHPLENSRLSESCDSALCPLDVPAEPFSRLPGSVFLSIHSVVLGGRGERPSHFCNASQFFVLERFKNPRHDQKAERQEKAHGEGPHPSPACVWDTHRPPGPSRPVEASSEEDQQHVKQRPLGSGIWGPPEKLQASYPIALSSQTSLSMHMEVPKSFVILLSNLNQGIVIYDHGLTPAHLLFYK